LKPPEIRQAAVQQVARIQPTYEELKPVFVVEMQPQLHRIQPTYEELKHIELAPNIVSNPEYPAYL